MFWLTEISANRHKYKIISRVLYIEKFAFSLMYKSIDEIEVTIDLNPSVQSESNMSGSVCTSQSIKHFN